MKTQKKQRDGADNDKLIIINNTEPIPLDLIIEILARLPAKSLFKFRCVSKEWSSIIRSRTFIDSYMSLSLSRPLFSIGYFSHKGNETRLLLFSSPLHPQESNHSSSSVSRLDMPDSRITARASVSLVNSVRGIILVQHHQRGFVICNPTTRQVIRLPEYSNSKSSFCHMFLGYNPSNDQYKILRRITKNDGPVVEHSVCSLQTGQESSWRHVETNVSYYLIGGRFVCIDGVLYYGVGTRNSSLFAVVSFDVGSERLRLIKGPVEDSNGLLINYQGKLPYFCEECLWVLDDVNQQWQQIWSTKNVVLSPFLRPGFSLCGSTEAGELVFVSGLIDNGVELFYYDIKKNNETRRVRVGGIRDDDDDNVFRHISVSCDHVENITYF